MVPTDRFQFGLAQLFYIKNQNPTNQFWFGLVWFGFILVRFGYFILKTKKHIVFWAFFRLFDGFWFRFDSVDVFWFQAYETESNQIFFTIF
jgi:hypothetical protein